MPVTFSARGPIALSFAVSPEVSQFLARSSSLDTPHTAAYTALIDGLVADGVWAKLDTLYIFATQNQATALQNLKSSSYTATIAGSVTFAADDGFTLPGTGTDYVNTNFNAFTAGGNYTQNSAHLSVWMFSDNNIMSGVVGATPAGGFPRESIAPRYGGGDGYYRLNTNGNGVQVTTPASGAGMSLGNRTSSANTEAFNNGASIGTDSASTTVTIANNTFTFPDLFYTENGNICSGGSMGSSLTSGDVAAFYSRMRTYMTAVGVP